MMKHCPVCNIEFRRDKLSQKYCSEECRLERVRQYDRDRKRKERAEQRVIRNKEKQRIQQTKKEAREKTHQEIIKARELELMARVNDGDPLAIMMVSKPHSKEYWNAYKQYAIDYANSWNRESTRTVNDISVYEDKFADKVINSIEELGHIRTNL